MRSVFMLVLSLSTLAHAQETGNVVFQSQVPGPGIAVSGGVFAKVANSVVQAAPY